ncbi:MAG: nitrous oxide reductase family maturation protein NosD [Promethearchaeota archaeon]
MNFNLKKILFSFCILSLITLGLISIQGNVSFKKIELMPKMQAIGPLQIKNNDEFEGWATYLGWLGNGTKDDPYIIEDEVFDGNSYLCLLIWETTVYFIIRNCEFINSNGHDAVSLRRIQNGKLINNVISDDQYNGFDLSYSSNFVISENTITNSGHLGIEISYSTNITLSDNVLNNNGYGGLQISSSSNILCKNNTASNNVKGFDIQKINTTKIIQNTMKNNTNEGIYALECNQTEILENAINENVWGIRLSSSINNTISENIINSNNQYGIYLSGANYTLIKDNNLLGNGKCIYEYNCEGNIFEDNVCKKGSSTTISGYYIYIIIGIIFLTSLIVLQKKYKYRS